MFILLIASSTPYPCEQHGICESTRQSEAESNPHFNPNSSIGMQHWFESMLFPNSRAYYIYYAMLAGHDIILF